MLRQELEKNLIKIGRSKYIIWKEEMSHLSIKVYIYLIDLNSWKKLYNRKSLIFLKI